DVVPGPRWLATPLAVTGAAQLGVAPVLVPVFGGLPVVALPANLLALPAAAPVTAWGVAAGVPAGMIGGSFARLAHVPTSLLVGWVAAVARRSAALPLGQLRMGHVALLLALSAAGAVVPRGRRVLAVAAVAVLAAAVASGRVPE